MNEYSKVKVARAEQKKADSGGGGKFAFFSYPKGVYFCLGNEFTERFSYYGMRAVLTFYLTTQHHYDDSTAKLIFHSFVCLAYFTPLLGSILADGFFGRYKVILYVSALYCAGHLLLTLGSLPIPLVGDGLLRAADFAGLFTIAVATGGIKPCVSAFAADQFTADQVEQRTQFFSFFYFSINFGALLSQFLTPVLRGRVSCMGKDTCFPLAFGVPSAVMVLAMVIFICGTPFYVGRNSTNTDNVLWRVCQCVFYALRRKIGRRGARKRPVEHWLDEADEKFGHQLVSDIKGVLDILVLFTPVVVFWALFDQQGSTWILQADRMNGRLGSLTLLPDQVSLLNPLLIITLIPVFELFVYPFLTKRHLLTRPLQRMGAGGCLAALSFFVAGFLQLKINGTMITPPAERMVRLSVIIDSPGCELDIGGSAFYDNFSTVDVDRTWLTANANSSFLNCSRVDGSSSKQNLILDDTKIPQDAAKSALAILIWRDRSITTFDYALKKSAGGNSTLLIAAYPNRPVAAQNSSLRRISVSQNDEEHSRQNFDGSEDLVAFKLRTPLIGSNVFDVRLKACTSDDLHNSSSCSSQTYLNSLSSVSGSVDLLIFYDDNSGSTTSRVFNLIQPNSVNVFWQVPQYLLITVGELLFSISGLEFSYSQASKSMKSVLQAIWLLTVAFGNIIDMVISGSHLVSDPALEFFVYALIMAAVMVVFIFMAYRYKYVDRDAATDSKSSSFGDASEMTSRPAFNGGQIQTFADSKATVARLSNET